MKVFWEAVNESSVTKHSSILSNPSAAFLSGMDPYTAANAQCYTAITMTWKQVNVLTNSANYSRK